MWNCHFLWHYQQICPAALATCNLAGGRDCCMDYWWPIFGPQYWHGRQTPSCSDESITLPGMFDTWVCCQSCRHKSPLTLEDYHVWILCSIHCSWSLYPTYKMNIRKTNRRSDHITIFYVKSEVCQCFKNKANDFSLKELKQVIPSFIMPIFHIY